MEADYLKTDSLENVASLEKPKPRGYTKEIEVAGFKYLINHPDPDTAILMGIDLTKIVGEPVAAMAIAGADPVSAMQNAAKLFLQKVEPQKTLSILKKVLSYVELLKNENNPHRTMLTDVVLKAHFQGRHGDMLQLGIEAMVFQQADFFLATKRTIQRVMNQTKE